MCIYLVVDLILFFLGYIYSNQYRNHFFYISALIMLIVTGLHNGRCFQPEVDFNRYMLTFFNQDGGYGRIDIKNGFNLEPAYAYLVKFLQFFGKQDYTYIMGTAIIFGLPFLVIVKRFSASPPLSILLLFVILDTSILLIFIAGHRQMLATIFFILAYILYFGYEFRLKKYFVILFLIIPLFAHSSSYLVLPMALGILFIPITKKRTILYMLTASLLAGLILTSFFSNIVHSLMFILSSFESLERTTNYTVNDIYEENIPTINNLAPITLFTATCVYFSSKDEIRSYPVKSLYIATILKNTLGFLPLINRGLTLFILIGIAGAIPQIINHNKQSKSVIMLIIAGLIFVAFLQYTKQSYMLLPYEFIFE